MVSRKTISDETVLDAARTCHPPEVSDESYLVDGLGAKREGADLRTHVHRHLTLRGTICHQLNQRAQIRHWWSNRARLYSAGDLRELRREQLLADRAIMGELNQ